MKSENLPRFLLLSLALLTGLPLVAGRTPGLSMTAFNVAVPGSDEDAVFSPFGFEVDCAVVSETFDSIARAKFVETLGALTGYDSVYLPVLRFYSADHSNCFHSVSTRAFLAPTFAVASVRFRIRMQEDYGIQVCPLKPNALAAESYLKVAMDGEMEDLALSEKVRNSKFATFCDLQSLRWAWLEPFPTSATRRVAFAAADGKSREVEMMSGRPRAALWTTRRFTVLRLPMAENAFFFAVLPAVGERVGMIRDKFAADGFQSTLVFPQLAGDPAVYKGSVAVSLPKLVLDRQTDLAPVFRHFKLPTAGFREIKTGLDSGFERIVQRTRFVLDERGVAAPAADGGGSQTAADGADRSFVANRPFIFFIYHEPTRTVPVAGIYAGVEKPSEK